MNDSPKQPLSNRIVVITRATAQSADFIAALESYGATVLACPTIEITDPLSFDQLDEAIDHLYGYDWIIFTSTNGVDYFLRRQVPNAVVVAPDIGSVKMARAYAKRLSASLAIVDKRRPRPDAVEMMNVIGEVEGKNVVIFDDIVSTGSTLVEAAKALKDAGAHDIYAAATHGVLCGDAAERIASSPVKELVVTDSIPHAPGSLPQGVRVLSVAPLLAEAIRRIHDEESLSSMFI